MPADPMRTSGFWARFLDLLMEAAEEAVWMSRLTDARSRRLHALDLVDRWSDRYGVQIPGAPRFLSRRIVRAIAARVMDAAVARVETARPGSGR